MRMNKIASKTFWSQTLIFQIEKKSQNCLIFQFGQFQKLQIWKIRKIFNLGISENSQFGKFKKI